MPLLYKRFVLFSILIASFSFLAACSHKNPLVDEKIIRALDEDFFLRGDGQPINECAHYFIDPKQNLPLKNKCEGWTKKYYRSLMNKHFIPVSTTLKDFRDPDFWKKIKAFSLL
ncbi:hypothetical protein [Rickettsiella endosymbiont of Miltochrista miniata]|uniref:hypothetical protein n=1 Tax=Rickettsiella endosymbiont of Miltochrista miniata TaxID=3066239 RepID=UPI00313CC4E6